MNSIDAMMEVRSRNQSAFAPSLEAGSLQKQTPAALAVEADPGTGERYVFFSTQRIIQALEGVGFVPVAASQAHTRRSSPQFAPHVIRFRRRFETVTLRDSICEILCLNSHNGRTALQFRLALYRPVCTNGLIVCSEALPVWKVAHRQDYFERAIEAVLRQAEQFSVVGEWVERMERTVLDREQRLQFAQQALEARFETNAPAGMEAAALLETHRPEDQGDDLWHVYNTIQSNVIQGGMLRQTPSGRMVRTRPIRAIARDVEINVRLWQIATGLVN